MKHLSYLVVLSLFFSVACTKTAEKAATRIRGKFVYSSCATQVVQVLDSNYFNLGIQWQKSSTDPVYDNVFTVENGCDFLTAGLKTGDEFYFELVTNATAGCGICALWDNPPTKKQMIKILK